MSSATLMQVALKILHRLDGGMGEYSGNAVFQLTLKFGIRLLSSTAFRFSFSFLFRLFLVLVGCCSFFVEICII